MIRPPSKFWKATSNETTIVTRSFSTTTRIAIGLTSLSIGCLLVALCLGMIPDAIRAKCEGRCTLAESVAVQCCLAAQRDDVKTMQTVLDELVKRNDFVLSAAIRRCNGEIAAEAGENHDDWQESSENLRPGAQLKVSIYQGREPWGTLEMRCQPLGYSGWRGSLMNPTAPLIIFLAVSGFLVHRFYLERVLRQFNPTPDRVRALLDTLAEGVVIVDNQQQIVLANRAFADRLGKSPDALQGLMPSEFGWTSPEGKIAPETLPWVVAIRQGETQTGVVLRVPGPGAEMRTFSVNAMPIVGERGERRGALATFDDVTKIEQQNIELADIRAALTEARDQIQRQNWILNLLATCDPLIAGNLSATVACGEAAEVSHLAAQFEHAATAEPDLTQVIQVTKELLDLCRARQRSNLTPESHHRA